MHIPIMMLCEVIRKHPGSIILDPEDYEIYKLNRVSRQQNGYFLIYIGKNRRYLHKVIAGVHDGSVDHKNGVPWDCRKDNLRKATTAQNMQNVGLSIMNTSGYKGVHWCKGSNAWQANIRCNGKKYYLGCFKTAAAAHEAYKKKALELHGEFANF